MVVIPTGTAILGNINDPKIQKQPLHQQFLHRSI